MNRIYSFIREYFLIILFSILLVGYLLFYFFGYPTTDVDDIKIPLDHSLSLEGVDTNKNGIRDDIDQFIKIYSDKRNLSSQQVKALNQIAKAQQLEVVVNSEKEILDTANKLNDAIECMSIQFKDNWLQITEKMSSLSLNTRRRILKSADFDHKMSWSVIGQSMNGCNK